MFIEIFKKKHFFLLIILHPIFTSCFKQKEKKIVVKPIAFNGFTINGMVDAKTDTYVYLLDDTSKKIDSSKIKKQHFFFKGNTKKNGVYFLSFNNNTTPFIIENNNFKAILNNFEGNVYGGKINTAYRDYVTKNNALALKQSKHYDALVRKDLNLKTYLNKIDSLHKIQKNTINTAIVNNQQNILSTLIIQEHKFSSTEITQFITKIDTTKSVALYQHLKTLASELKIIEAKNKILRRPIAPLFSGINLDGSISSLENLRKGKKLFLIDFWASWCPPCRQSSPKIIELYNAYQGKGFDILTVSEDRSVNDWKNGIYQDEIESWHHIYDDYNRISNLYKVRGLPHLVLIDENGKIIKNKISITDLKLELEQKLN